MSYTKYELNAWTPTLVGGTTPGTTTYGAFQLGEYYLIGNLCVASANIVITGATGTGVAVFSLPFPAVSNGAGKFAMSSATWGWNGRTQMLAVFAAGATNFAVARCGNGLASDALAINNSAAQFTFTVIYEI